MIKQTFFKAFSAVAIIFLLSACSAQSGTLTLSEQLDVLKEDLHALFHTNEIEKPITLYEAMARALKYNMDHRLAAAEEAVTDGNVTLARLSMLPTLEAKGKYVGRNKESASSSRSISTGIQSLEPSTSTERHRKTASLEASWNILDTGLSFVQSRQESDRAKIATERHRKVTHNIIQDVRYAYWRAVGAQEILSSIEELMNKGNQTITTTQKAEKAGVLSPEKSLQTQSRLLGTMDELMTMRSQLSFAHIELSSLMNLSTSSKFKLAENTKEIPFEIAAPDLGVSTQDLETLALLARPEIREEFYQKNIASNDIKLTVLETFPGANILFSQSYDSNTFLENESWADFSLGLTQNIMRLFTLPARLKQSRMKENLTNFKRQALTVAIMAQVHVADSRFNLSKDRLSLLKRIHGVNKKMVHIARSQKIAKTLTDADLLEVEMGLLLSRVRTYLAFAEMQNSYGQVINSIGVDVIPEEAMKENIQDLASILENSMKQLSSNSLKDVITFINKTKNKELIDDLVIDTIKESKTEVTIATNINSEEIITRKTVPFPSKKPMHSPVFAENKKPHNIPFLGFKGLYKGSTL